MADVFVPGINSRFNTEGMIDDLMRLERVPRERSERNVERFQNNISYWNDVSQRASSLRDSARYLFSFQNPFNDRLALSSDDSVLTATAARDALQQERSFTVKQVATADRFLSRPLDSGFTVEAGTYTFSVGSEDVSFGFKGGSLREFSDALNRRGRGILQSSLVAVRSGTTSLLIESKVTGEENRLNFADAAISLGQATGMIEGIDNSPTSFTDTVISAQAGSTSEVQLGFQVPASGGNWVLSVETLTELRPVEEAPLPLIAEAAADIPEGTANSDSVAREGEPDSEVLSEMSTELAAPLPALAEDNSAFVDNLAVLSITFADGQRMDLPPLTDSESFQSQQYELSGFAEGRTIASLTLRNDTSNRDISMQNVQIFSTTHPQVTPLNPVSTAQDAIIAMDGIEMQRESNEIDDILPGVTLTARRASDRPVTITVEGNTDAIKDSIIAFVGNYNRLMAEINVLTAPAQSTGLNSNPTRDARIIEELTYLTPAEAAAMRERLGAFSGDSTLVQMRSNLMRIVGAPYPTSSERGQSLLAQIGISTDVQWGGASSGFDSARLRGYLQIDERSLDNALATQLPVVRELFGSDSSGNRLVDTGIAFNVDAITWEHSRTAGIFSLKTDTLNANITQETRRIQSLNNQLAQREADLRRQYSQMEDAFGRMEQMSTSLDRFQPQGNQ